MAVRGAALRSQLPLTALMVVYTFIDLSITAEPIVGNENPPCHGRDGGDPYPC